MKTKSIIVGIILCTALAVVNGCKKQETAPPPGGSTASEAPASEAAKAVDAVKTTAKEATDEAAARFKAAEQQAQGLIDKAKACVADGKYQDALGNLSQLGNLKLTADQQKLVDDLKAQIQKALAKATATDPASALGGALGGKK